MFIFYGTESTAEHPSQLPETLENNDETEIPPTKQRRGMQYINTYSSHSLSANIFFIMYLMYLSAKQQVKPNTTKRKRASKTLAAKEAESVPITQHSELPGPSVQPKAVDDVVTEPQKGSGDHVEVETGEEPEESRSGAQTKRTKGTSCRKR